MSKRDLREKEIDKKLSTPEGRKELADQMVGPIAKAMGLIPKSAKKTKKTKKTKTIKVVKDEKGEIKKVIETPHTPPTPPATIHHEKPKPQHRPTLEEIKKAKEKEAQRIANRNQTMRALAGIGAEASIMNNDFMGNMLALGLKQVMGHPQLNEEIKELEAKKRETISLISESPKYSKAQRKMIRKVEKKLRKLKDKTYKKLKKRFGKKISKIIMCNSAEHFSGMSSIWDVEYPTSKKLQAKYEQLSQLQMAVVEEKQEAIANCPRISPSDTSFSDHSFIWGKERVQLPGDSDTGLDIRKYTTPEQLEELTTGSVEEVVEECVDLQDLANKMP